MAMRLLKKILKKISTENLNFLYSALGEALFARLARENQNRLHWENQNNRRSGRVSPWSPSLEDLGIYKKYLREYIDKECLSPRSLLLGTTPALRLLLSELKIPYIVADQSLSMLDRSLSRLPKHVLEKEMWIRANWLSLPLPRDCFDIIIGDLVLFQFFPREQDAFLLKIKELLRRGGTFVTRVHAVSPALMKNSTISIIQSIISEETNEEIASNRIMAALFDRCGDIATGSTGRLRALEEVKKYQPQTAHEERVIKRIFDDWGRSFLDYALQDREDIEMRLKKYFSGVTFASASDYFEADFYPLAKAFR